MNEQVERIRARLYELVAGGGKNAEQARRILAKLPTRDAGAMARGEMGAPVEPSIHDQNPSAPIAQRNDFQRLVERPRNVYEVDPNTVGAPGGVPAEGEAGSSEPKMRIAQDPNNPIQHDPLAQEIVGGALMSPVFNVLGRAVSAGARGMLETEGAAARQTIKNAAEIEAERDVAAHPFVDPSIPAAEQALRFRMLPGQGTHGFTNAAMDMIRHNSVALQGRVGAPAAEFVLRRPLTTPLANFFYGTAAAPEEER